MAIHIYKCSRCGYTINTERPPQNKDCPHCDGRLFFKGFGRALMRWMR